MNPPAIDPIAALVVLITGLVASFFVAAIVVGAWLRYLGWRWNREVRRLEVATARLQAVASDGEIAGELDLASDALRRSEEARRRYERACRRFGIEPWRVR